MLEPIKFFCNCALPAVYDDSLSYYEVLTKLAYKLNDTITALNTLTVSVTGDANTQELKANVNSIGYEDTGGISEFTQTYTLITTVKQAIDEINKSLKTLADGSFTNTNNLAVSVDANSVAIDNINGDLDKVANSLTGSGSYVFSGNIANVGYNNSTHTFTKGATATTNLKTATSTLTTSFNTMVDGINNNTDLNEIEHTALSTRIHTAEDNIAQLNQTDVQELADISKLKTSITGSDNAVFKADVKVLSYSNDKQAFVVTEYVNVTDVKSVVARQNASVNAVVTELNSMKEDIKNNNSELTQNLALLSGQVNDLENTVDGLSSSLNISGWNRIGSGNIVIITPAPYTGFNTMLVEQFATAMGFNLTESNGIFLINPSTPTLRNLSLSKQIFNLTGGMTGEQRTNTTMVYAVGTGIQDVDTKSDIEAAKTLFPNAHFVYAPDCWFNISSKDEADYSVNYNALGCNVVRNGWRYLIGSDINTSAITQVAYDQAPHILLDLLFTGDSNRYTEVRYYGGTGSTTTFASPAFILKRYGKDCIIDCIVPTSISQPPFGVTSYTNCFRLTNYLAFANVTVTNYGGTTYNSSGAITCATIGNVQCAIVRGTIINPTQAQTTILKTASLNVV
jgi:hypothetical protein|nr:MAG TPA: hypothetical protein [Caudoviricetes sp.]